MVLIRRKNSTLRGCDWAVCPSGGRPDIAHGGMPVQRAITARGGGNEGGAHHVEVKGKLTPYP